MVEVACQNKKIFFLWWMPTYITGFFMGIAVLAMFMINEIAARAMLEDDGLIQILTAAVLIAWLFTLSTTRTS